MERVGVTIGNSRATILTGVNAACQKGQDEIQARTQQL